MAEENPPVMRQKAFLLLQVFMAPDRRLKQSDLSKKFNTKAIREALGDKSALEAVRDDLVS